MRAPGDDPTSEAGSPETTLLKAKSHFGRCGALTSKHRPEPCPVQVVPVVCVTVTGRGVHCLIGDFYSVLRGKVKVSGASALRTNGAENRVVGRVPAGLCEQLREPVSRGEVIGGPGPPAWSERPKAMLPSPKDVVEGDDSPDKHVALALGCGGQGQVLMAQENRGRWSWGQAWMWKQGALMSAGGTSDWRPHLMAVSAKATGTAQVARVAVDARGEGGLPWRWGARTRRQQLVVEGKKETARG